MDIFAYKNRGFTLIEILVVIAIIGIIAGVVYASLGVSSKKMRDRSRSSDMLNIQLALRLYKDAYGEYPEFDEGVVIGKGGTIDTVLNPYFSTIPRDPLGDSDATYEYHYDSKVMCANTDQQYDPVIFVTKMEVEGAANWDEVCGNPGIGDPIGRGVGVGSGYGNDNATSNSYGVLLR